MKRFLTIPVLVAVVHLLLATSIIFLSGIPAAITFYLGLFGSSEELGFAFTLFYIRSYWLLLTFHASDAPTFWWLCQLASSAFYGLFAAGVLSVVRAFRHRHTVA